MTDNEKLIEEAREVVRSWDLKGSWNADSPVGMLARMADALEAAEKAHTPTDDEREADERAILNALYDSRESFMGVGAEVGTDETAILVDYVPEIVLALGFRRPEVPEPSTEHGCDLGEDCDGRCNEVAGETPGFISCPCGWSRVGFFHQLHEHQRTHAFDAEVLPRPHLGEPSDAPKRLVHEVNMILSSVASHGPAALTDTSDRMYTTGLLRRLRDALDPKPAHRLAAGNAVRAEMARNGLDVHRMVYGQEIANVLAGVALDAALRAAGVTHG